GRGLLHFLRRDHAQLRTRCFAGTSVPEGETQNLPMFSPRLAPRPPRLRDKVTLSLQRIPVDKLERGGLRSNYTRLQKGTDFMKNLSKFFVLAAVLAIVVRMAPAQFETATVLGTVKDATGSGVVGS